MNVEEQIKKSEQMSKNTKSCKKIYQYIIYMKNIQIEYVAEYLEEYLPDAAKRRAKCDSGVSTFARVKE